MFSKQGMAVEPLEQLRSVLKWIEFISPIVFYNEKNTQKKKKPSNINLFESHRLKLAIKLQNTLCLSGVVIIRKVIFIFIFLYHY